MMYETLIYNTQVTVTTLPLFYFDVNKILRLNYPDLGISGDFVITNVSWALGHTATM